MPSRYMDLNNEVTFSTENNPYWDNDYLKKQALIKFTKPLSEDKWRNKILDAFYEYRNKFYMHNQQQQRDSSLNQARDILETAENLQGMVSRYTIWEPYYDSYYGVDVNDGLSRAINALKAMLKYADPYTRINLEKADPKLVKGYAKSYLGISSGFDEAADEMTQKELIKFARLWIEKCRAWKKKPAIKTAGVELVRSLATIWEKACQPKQDATSAWENTHRKQDQKTGKYIYYGNFLDFVYAAYEIFDELPEENQDADSQEEIIRLQKQALYGRIETALLKKTNKNPARNLAKTNVQKRKKQTISAE